MTDDAAKSRSLHDDSDAEEDAYDKSLFKEAERVVKEISFGVESAHVSQTLDSSNLLAFINIRTLEKRDYCVELSTSGYAVVAEKFDTVVDKDETDAKEIPRFETFEALMNALSPMFVEKFNLSVAERLQKLV